MGTDSEMTYSVLMAVYGKENPEFLRHHHMEEEQKEKYGNLKKIYMT